MASPSLRSIGTSWVGPTNAPSFAEPAGAVANDIIEIKFFLDGTNTVSTAPTGFVAAPNAPAVNTNHSLQIYWARRSAAGAGPYVFALASTTHTEGAAFAIQGATTSGNPYEASSGANSGGASVSTAPLVSATSLGTDRYASYAATNWSGGTWTAPTGYTKQYDLNNHIVISCDLAMPTAATTSPQATCTASDKMCAWLGIMIPDVAGAAVATPGPIVTPPWSVVRASTW